MLNDVQLLTNPVKTDKSESTESFSQSELDLLRSKLVGLLDKEEAFLDSGLSLRSLAQKLDVHPNKLSKYINDQLQTNFNELINSRRLRYFQKITLDPKNKDFTLLGLAFESGFNSKTVFNTYFKKTLGTTPRQWLKSNR